MAKRDKGNNAFSALRITNFRYLLKSTLLVDAAIWTQQVALNWLVYNMTGSGTILGLLNFIRSFSGLTIIPFAGEMIDRYPRRKFLLVVNGARFLLNLLLAVILLTHNFHILVLFAFSCLFGMAQLMDQSMRQVAIFDLVPRELTPNSVAMVQTGWALMRSLGPGIGGFLILWVGVGGNFLVLAGLYILIILMILKINFPTKSVSSDKKGSIFSNMREGMHFIRSTATTRHFVLLGFVLPICIIPLFFLMPVLYAKDVFHGGPDIQGLLTASVGVGGVLGGFATASLGRFEYRARLLLASLILLSLSLIGFSFCTKLWAAFLCLGLAGFFEMIFLATNQALIQLSIPDHLRGRLTTMVNLNGILAPMGGMLAGVACDVLVNPRTVTQIMSGIAAVIACFILLFFPDIRNYRISEAIGQ